MVTSHYIDGGKIYNKESFDNCKKVSELLKKQSWIDDHDINYGQASIFFENMKMNFECTTHGFIIEWLHSEYRMGEFDGYRVYCTEIRHDITDDNFDEKLVLDLIARTVGYKVDEA